VACSFKGGSFFLFEKMGFLNFDLHVQIFVTTMIVILMGTLCVADTDPVDGIVYTFVVIFNFGKTKRNIGFLFIILVDTFYFMQYSI
jgi:hypothetical protein